MVTGAGGGVGIHAVQLAAMMGARVMAVDITADKLDAARARGAEVVVNPEQEDLATIARSWTGGRGLDGILELVGPATMPAGLASLAKGGRMVVVGSHTGTELTISPHAFYQNELELLGSRNVSVGELAEVVDLVAVGKVEPVVSGTYPLEEVEELHREGAQPYGDRPRGPGPVEQAPQPPASRWWCSARPRRCRRRPRRWLPGAGPGSNRGCAASAGRRR